MEAKPYVRYPVREGDVPAYGGLADPRGATAEQGKLMAKACVREVARVCEEEFGK